MSHLADVIFAVDQLTNRQTHILRLKIHIHVEMGAKTSEDHIPGGNGKHKKLFVL